MSDIKSDDTTLNDAPAPVETDEITDDALDSVSGGAQHEAISRDAMHKERLHVEVR